MAIFSDALLFDFSAVFGVSNYVLALLSFLILIYFAQNEVTRYLNRIKGLPGPRGWPIVGNLFQVRV